MSDPFVVPQDDRLQLTRAAIRIERCGGDGRILAIFSLFWMWKASLVTQSELLGWTSDENVQEARVAQRWT